MGPLLTLSVLEQFRAARARGDRSAPCSLDLQRTNTTVDLSMDDWCWNGQRFPYPDSCKERTIYYWADGAFQPLARYTTSLIKLVPTDWGPPTFEIDGIKMLPTLRISPYIDAQRKVNLIEPRGKVILDTCGGLGYFAAWCSSGHASRIDSYEKNPDVIWLRSLNPWSPQVCTELTLTQADITVQIMKLAACSFDAILHDPPRFGIAGELYSQIFYDNLSRVLRRKGRLFHYTGIPNKLTSNRDVPKEVMSRLRRSGFAAASSGDGVLAVKS